MPFASYDLPLSNGIDSHGNSLHQPSQDFLPESIMKNNLLWFCNFRWMVIAVCLAYGLTSLSPTLSDVFNIQQSEFWPFVIALILIMSNITFINHSKAVLSRHQINVNLWLQIVFDLLILTVVVHFIGSLKTNIAFTYLFHIVLACVFLSRRLSFLVLLISALMYGSLVFTEYKTKLLKPETVFIDPVMTDTTLLSSHVLLWLFFSTIAIWLAVWYLASHISELVQKQDIELSETNRQLQLLQEERARRISTTTHELKSPFAAIYSNAQLLQQGYHGPLSPEAHDVVQKILDRCKYLSGELQEMLQLANITSDIQKQQPKEPLSISNLIQSVILQLEPLAKKHDITISSQCKPAHTLAVEDHIKILISNLISNAIHYSHTGDTVQITCSVSSNSSPLVTVKDQGIGIPEEKLPHIFDEFYRTSEAKQHNRQSTGLGLAIVKHIAELNQIQIHVESQSESGTTFILTFPPTPQPESPIKAISDERKGTAKKSTPQNI